MEPNENALPCCAVLMAVYNGMNYIEEQVQTILNQRDVSITLFVSVDESSDGSEEWFSALSQKDSRVVLLPPGGRFGGAAKNFFRLIRDINLEPYDYIAFSDQDDHWYPDKIKKASHFLSRSGYDAYSSNVTAFWANGKQALVNKAQTQRRWDYIFEAAGPGCTYVFTQTFLAAVKTHLLEHWDLIQAITLHDWFFYAFARANHYKWFINSASSMLYRQHDLNQLGANKGIRAYLNRFKQINNGWWFSQVVLITQVVGVKDTSFVKSWSQLRRNDFLRLATQVSHCRRGASDRVFLFVICILFAITGIRNVS